jgi:hypothetical protein
MGTGFPPRMDYLLSRRRRKSAGFTDRSVYQFPAVAGPFVRG